MRLDVIDKRQERPKERRRRPWLGWLCNPKSFTLFVLTGRAILAIVRFVIEVWTNLRS